jgi:hypothetical protein
MKANYSARYLGTETVKCGIKTWHLVLTPKTDYRFKSAELWVDINGMLVQAKVFARNNDSTTILFSETRKNETINKAVFQFKSPKSTKIIKTFASPLSCNIVTDSEKKTLKEVRKVKRMKKVKVRKKRLPLRGFKNASALLR